MRRGYLYIQEYMQARPLSERTVCGSLHYTTTVRVLLYKFIKGRQRREMLAALFHR